MTIIKIVVHAIHPILTLKYYFQVGQCRLPINISTKKLATNNQKAQRIRGRNCEPRTREVSTIGIANKINNELNIANTPKSLLGIECKMA